MASAVLIVGCSAGVAVIAVAGYGFVSFVRISIGLVDEVDEAEEELFAEANVDKEDENEG
jgi:hypothetical protein